MAIVGYVALPARTEASNLTPKQVAEFWAALVQESKKGKERFKALDHARASAPHLHDFLRLFPEADHWSECGRATSVAHANALGRSVPALKEVCSAAGCWYHARMKTILPLKEMTTAEKMRAMEEIWADLSDSGSGFVPPDWHGEVLAEREKGIRDGSQRFTDWEAAKKEIRERVS